MFFIRRTLLGAGIAAPALVACASPTTPAPDGDTTFAEDVFSHARPAEARVRHVSLDLTADFSRRVFSGTASLEIEKQPDANEIVLDVDGLNIRSVRTNVGPTTWRMTEHRPDLGSGMIVALQPGATRVIIDYETSPDAGGLQWLEPPQTSGAQPFMFSQGQAILTRTWIPTQDSPGIRQTYDARIVVPDGLTAVMSAVRRTPNGRLVSGGMRAFQFDLDRPIPPYLIAVGIGDLEFRRIGARTGVFAEPAVIEAAAYEFVDMERMVEAAEALYGDYRWGRFDVLVLPPSFPYGGMENPTLTFATPTLLAGDRSLVDVIAHELAHNWAGNLVTNAIWPDFWVNESFTTYFTGRIVEALYGADVADMQYVLGWAAIQTALADRPPAATSLHAVPGADPMNQGAAIIYDKGALFLRTIERIVGRARWDAYLRSYFDRHAFQSMTSERFLADFRTHVIRGDAALEERLQLQAWIYEPGLPSNAEQPHATRFDRVDADVAAFAAGGAPNQTAWASWGTHERQRFLQTLPRELPAARLTALEAAFDLNDIGNSEVLFDWQILAIRNRFEPTLPSVESFLTRQGRGKFIRPIYTALMAQADWGQPHARRIYDRARDGYHAIVRNAVDRIVVPG